MEIRDTLEADAEALADLIDRVSRERRYLAATTGFSADGTRAFIADVRAAGGVHIVATCSGALVGWCDIAPHAFEGLRHAGRLGTGVAKGFRSQGIGSRLLAAAIEKAFSQGLERIELEVFASNEGAMRLYERCGFEAEGRKVRARKLDGATDDVLLYAKLKNA